MKKFLIKKGIVKTEQQANYVLIAIIILCFIFIFSQLMGDSSSRPDTNINETNEFSDDGILGDDLDAQLDTQLQ